MDRNNKLLKFIFISVAFATLMNCFNEKKEDDSIYDSDTKYLDLSKAEGKYYFIPNNNEYVDEYKLFNLKRGDTIFLEIKSDSSFIFNHFYYNKRYGSIELNKIDNYKGNVKKSNNSNNENKIQIPFPNDTFDVQGFLLSKKDTIFYYRLSTEKYSNYAYRIIFKKMK